MKVDEILVESWNVFIKNIVALVIGALIAVLGSLLIIPGPPLMFGLYGMAIKGVRGEKVEIANVFDGFNYFVKSWVLAIVSGAMFLIGFVLLVIPGLIVAVLLTYSVPLILIENLGAIEGLKRSIDLAKRNFKFTATLTIVVFAINFVGGMVRVGTILTMPFTMLCVARATDLLLQNK